MDLITYVEDINQLRLDIAEIANSEIEHVAKPICSNIDDVASLIITKIPTAKKDNASVSLIRNTSEEVIESIPSITVIGWLENGEYKFYPYGRDKYESVYNVEPKSYVDESGDEQVYTPPYMMGVFA